MCVNIISKNLAALRTVNPSLAHMLEHTDADSSYTSVIESRTGLSVPCYTDGTPANSRFDPVSEARRMVEDIPEDSFVFFSGITGGYHIRVFLEDNPDSSCVVAEKSLSALKSLLSIIPLDDLVSRTNLYLLPDCSPETLLRELPRVYLPAIHGSFSVFSPRSWESRFSTEAFRNALGDTISVISGDYSVQVHFGRMWFTNTVRNIALMEKIRPAVQNAGGSKTAIIAAAGPTLESRLPRILENRHRYAVFSTDTAFGTLQGYGIVPDYYVTIDPQYYSSLHLYHELTSETTIIADLCANPAVIKKALEAEAPVLLTAGGHPLAQYASGFSPLPRMDTSSGTVTAAARYAACAMGYDNPCVIGADFAYVHGKPYSRGTYLSTVFGSDSSRLAPMESSFITLMFRTEVETLHDTGGITYIPPILHSYRNAFEKNEPSVRWTSESPVPYPAIEFLAILREKLDETVKTDNPDTVFEQTMLPFVAWYQNRYKLPPGQKSRKKAFQLALDIIAGYTGLS